MNRPTVQQICEVRQHDDADIQGLVDVRYSLPDVLLWEDSAAHFLHGVKRFLRKVDAFPRVA